MLSHNTWYKINMPVHYAMVAIPHVRILEFFMTNVASSSRAGYDDQVAHRRVYTASDKVI